MELEHFGYRGSFVHTQPLSFTNSDESLFLCATPFGNTEVLEEALAVFMDEIERQTTDFDSTSPYPRLTCFNTQENLLYTSVQFLNDYIFSNYNKEEFKLGCDFFCAYKSGGSLYFTQVGWPLILLNQNNRTLPISSDYAISPGENLESPFLPTNLLGLEASLNFKIQRIALKAQSELLLLKSNSSPRDLFHKYPCPLEEIAQAFAKDQPNQGFWLGKISL